MSLSVDMEGRETVPPCAQSVRRIGKVPKRNIKTGLPKSHGYNMALSEGARKEAHEVFLIPRASGQSQGGRHMWKTF